MCPGKSLSSILKRSPMNKEKFYLLSFPKKVEANGVFKLLLRRKALLS